MLDRIRTNVVASPIPKPFIAEVVVPNVGHIPKTSTKVGLSLIIPLVIILNLLISVLLSLPTLVYVKESESLMDEVRRLSLAILEECADRRIQEWGTIKNKVKDGVSALISERTGRYPMILPILMEV